MSAAPIPEQSGLSPEELAKMKPVEQEYKPSGDTSLQSKSGTENQRGKISNNIHHLVSEFYKDCDKIDEIPKYNADGSINEDYEYARYNKIKTFSGNMADFICSLITTQKVSITTSVTTVSTIVGNVTTPSGATVPTVLVGDGSGSGELKDSEGLTIS